MHVSGHVGLLLQLGLQDGVLHHSHTDVHLNHLLLQLGQALLDFDQGGCKGEETRVLHSAQFLTCRRKWFRTQRQ